jgi:methionyl-tRNA formyltransferase
MSLFKEVWPAIRNGNTKRNSQCGQASYHVMNDFKKARKVDPEQKMRVVDFINYLRAMTFSPFDNAYIEMDGEKYFIEINIKEEQTLICNEDKPFLKQYGFEND